MTYNSIKNRKDYYPPLLSNGELIAFADCEGSTLHDPECYPDAQVPTGRFYMAGRRASYDHKVKSPAPLLFWGGLKFECGKSIKEFSQKLIEKEGFVSSECVYDDGLRVKTDCFISANSNIYAVRKRFSQDCKNVRFVFSLDESLTDDVKSIKTDKNNNSASFELDIKAYDRYESKIILYCSQNATITISDNCAVFELDAFKEKELCFYYVIEDSLYNENYKDVLDNSCKSIIELGFEGLLNNNKSVYNSFYELGYVNTQNELINDVYSSAAYLLKCHTTRFSIAVGISDISWHGKYFAFDEYYCMLALLQAGRTELAKRVPSFRAKVCLERAIRRATKKTDLESSAQARFSWESGESGEELSPIGYWHEHIFHMAVIAQGAFEYYEYTGDVEFLKECYAMIKACAMFYTKNSVYRNFDGSVYVGKCTDLERLGSAVENPYFTSCGIISTLEIFVKAAELLNVDEDYKNECKAIAKGLRKTLIHDGEKYVPHKACTQKSIAVFTGKYPFNVIDNADPKQLLAMYDFIENEEVYGNMYAYGKKVSMWYAAWKAVAFARLQKADDAYTALMQSIESAGVFAEAFEINEESATVRPWFTTAAGVFMSAVNEMLLQSDGQNIYLLPSAPNDLQTVSFKLLAKGGAVIEADIKNGELLKLDISFLPTATPKEYNIYLNGKKIKAAE